eukprot:GILI01002088.1.p1 GENE.GILI01002088.1~~GILI01002088.1.p1  ORF type:complete len:1106 (+),score=379.50 GILI01002088.1:190-3507(+)
MLDQVIASFLNPDNNIRNQAEQTFNAMKQQDPNAVVIGLLQILRTGTAPELRLSAALTFRREIINLGKENVGLWHALTPESRAVVKNELLVALEAEPIDNVAVKIRDAIAQLGSFIMRKDESDAPQDQTPTLSWPELLQALFKMLNAESPKFKHYSLELIACLIQYASTTFLQYQDHLVPILRASLEHPVVEVRASAFSVICSVISSTDSDEAKPFKPLLVFFPAVLASLAGDEEKLQTSLEILAETVAMEPKLFLKACADGLLQQLGQIVQNKDNEEGCRIIALETVMGAVEGATQFVQKRYPAYIASALDLALGLSLEVDENEAWATGARWEEEDDDESLALFGQEVIDRLGRYVGADVVTPILYPRVNAYIQNPDYRFRRAALMALSQMSEHLPDIGKVVELVPYLLQCFKDPHPRVRYAAVHCLGQMADDHQSDFQEKTHKVALPPLLEALNDPIPRVQSHVCAALVNFLESCSKDHVEGLVETMVQKLYQLANVPNVLVQEQALTAIAVLSSVVGEEFRPFYATVMAYLKQLLQVCTDKSHRGIRGRVFECAGFLGQAVGRELFAPDAVAIMELMVGTLTHCADDDPQRTFILQSLERFCMVLEDSFVPFLPHVMPLLLRSAAVPPDVITADTPENEEDEIECAYEGEVKIGMRTSILEEKSSSIEMLCIFASVLKAHFAPYVEQVSAIVLPLCSFPINENVRIHAASTLPELIKCISLACEQQNMDKAIVRNMFSHFLEAIIQSSLKEDYTEVLTTQLEALEECIVNAGVGCLDDASRDRVISHVMQTLSKSFQNRQKILDSMKQTEEDEDEDGEDKEESAQLRDQYFQDEEAQEDGVRQAVSEVLAAVMKTTGPAFLPSFNAIYPHALQLCTETNPDCMKRIGLFILVDFVEHLREHTIPYWGQIMEILLRYAIVKHPQLKQCCIYGLGVAASYGGAAFSTYCQAALHVFHQTITDPEQSKKKVFRPCVDNAVSALGKIIEFHSGSVDLNNVVPLWLSGMPLKKDLAEAHLAHERFIKLVESGNAAILGPNQSNLPRILYILADVYRTKRSTKELNARISALLRSMQSSYPAEILQAAWGQLSPEAQHKLLSAAQANA